MSCTDFNTLREFWANGQFFDGVFCAFGGPLAPMPGSAFVLVFSAFLGVGLYAFAGAIILPLVLAIILGGVVVAQLPGVVLKLVGMVVLLAIAAGGMILARRIDSP